MSKDVTLGVFVITSPKERHRARGRPHKRPCAEGNIRMKCKESAPFADGDISMKCAKEPLSGSGAYTDVREHHDSGSDKAIREIAPSALRAIFG